MAANAVLLAAVLQQAVADAAVRAYSLVTLAVLGVDIYVLSCLLVAVLSDALMRSDGHFDETRVPVTRDSVHPYHPLALATVAVEMIGDANFHPTVVFMTGNAVVRLRASAPTLPSLDDNSNALHLRLVGSGNLNTGILQMPAEPHIESKPVSALALAVEELVRASTALLVVRCPHVALAADNKSNGLCDLAPAFVALGDSVVRLVPLAAVNSVTSDDATFVTAVLD